MLFGFEDPTEVESERAPEAEPIAEPERNQRRPWLFAASGLVAGLLIALAIWAVRPVQEQLTQQDVDDAISEALAGRADPATLATNAYDQVAPSLVMVRVGTAIDTGVTIGSGVVINDQGQILTANHLLADATSIEVRFADGSVGDASVVMVDVGLDIAVLAAQSPSGVIVPAVIGNSRTVKIGDPVYAIGNPLGLAGSLSAGVISGLARSVPLPANRNSAATEELADLIQFDAAVNQGSSGGPLVNTDGQVIGIVTARADPGGQGIFTGIGFAVPIDIAAGRAADGPSQ